MPSCKELAGFQTIRNPEFYLATLAISILQQTALPDETGHNRLFPYGHYNAWIPLFQPYGEDVPLREEKVLPEEDKGYPFVQAAKHTRAGTGPRPYQNRRYARPFEIIIAW